MPRIPVRHEYAEILRKLFPRATMESATITSGNKFIVHAHDRAYFVSLHRDTEERSFRNEPFLSQLLARKGVPVSHVVSAGLATSTMGYVVREYVPSRTITEFFCHSDDLSPANQRDLMVQLGDGLGKMHSIATDGYGEVVVTASSTTHRPRAVDDTSTWVTYMDDFVAWLGHSVSRIPLKRRFGALAAGEFKEAWSRFERVYDSRRTVMPLSPTSSLIHNDAHLANFLATDNSLGGWRLAAFVDLDRVVSGDPDLDLVQVECSLMRWPRAHIFGTHLDNFREGYRRYRDPQVEPQSKASIYRLIRSCNYLAWVLGSHELCNSDPTPDEAFNIDINIHQMMTILDG